MIKQHIGCWVLIIFGTIIYFIGPMAQSVNAEQVLYVKNAQVNVRSAPTTTGKNIIATISQGTTVVVLQQQGAWYKVRLPDGREGWISRWGLELRETPSETQGQVTIQRARGVQAAVPDVPEKMIYISGGPGMIGSDEQDMQQVIRKWKQDVQRDALTDELPKQKMVVNAFYMDQYEVTNAEYKKFVDATRYPPPSHWKDGMYPENTGNHPVTFVSWDDAYAYAQWAGKRLPTAEEWEIAARGLNGRIFPWGNTHEAQRVNVNHPDGATAAVGSFADDVSAFKVYDMGGNVMEWTMSQYGNQKDIFVLKGSSWATKPFEARGANQTPGYAEYRLSHVGFRCAKSKTRD